MSVTEIIDAIEESRSEPTEIPPEIARDMAAESGEAESIEVINSPSTGTVDSVSTENSTFNIGVGAGPLSDRSGALWNPEFHETPARKNADGNWAKKRGRKTGAGNPTNPIPVDVDRVTCRRAAENVCLQIFTIAQAFLGPEWAPKIDPALGLNEKEMLVSAWEEYFIVSGIIKMPPWLGLSVAMGCYAFPRLAQPKYMERMKALKDWFFPKGEDDNDGFNTTIYEGSGK